MLIKGYYSCTPSQSPLTSWVYWLGKLWNIPFTKSLLLFNCWNLLGDSDLEKDWSKTDVYMSFSANSCWTKNLKLILKKSSTCNSWQNGLKVQYNEKLMKNNRLKNNEQVICHLIVRIEKELLLEIIGTWRRYHSSTSTSIFISLAKGAITQDS